jgi:pyruvate kinase
VSVKTIKRAKIIATIGPSTDSYEAILGVIKAGANGLRLNCSHGTNEERTKQIKWIRRASKELGEQVSIIQDLQGPKIRLGDFDQIVNVVKGQELGFAYNADYEATGHLPTQYDLSQKVKRGERLYLFDGKVKTTVTSVKDSVVHVGLKTAAFSLGAKALIFPILILAAMLSLRRTRSIWFGDQRKILTMWRPVSSSLPRISSGCKNCCEA